ncbi:MAG: T9SS type A sorting domain-containing protein [Bacteroidaceae bacterium]|nr:T9SS type A sorting domain-containing protein [Bacteroidaceae bacterium]
MKKLFLISFVLTWLAAPVSAFTDAESEPIENILSGIELTVNGTTVHVTGASGESMEIFNLTGVKVATITIDSTDKSFTLNLPKGCYILKVGKVVRKVSIR